ncbi:MAG: glucosamine-6-phosphate deaminase [Bacteroidales bacterium]|nr:glucosamine-6-phosphate deaminase [Bacteroidales bacterium]
MLKKEFKVDKLDIKIYDSRQSMGEGAASEAAEYLRNLLARQDEAWAVFAAAPSQNEFLEELSKAPGIDWHRIHALHMDEYVGLPSSAPQGFGNFLRRAIFDKVPFGSVDYIGGEADADTLVSRYDAILSRHHVDVVFMGIGENGHIAFNDPHVADFNDPARIKKVDLDLVCRQQQVNDGCFSCLDEVPEYALTLTVPTLFGADRLFCIVPSSTKANAVRATVEGPVEESCPASILRRHKAATLYVDSDSGKYIL